VPTRPARIPRPASGPARASLNPQRPPAPSAHRKRSPEARALAPATPAARPVARLPLVGAAPLRPRPAPPQQRAPPAPAGRLIAMLGAPSARGAAARAAAPAAAPVAAAARPAAPRAPRRRRAPPAAAASSSPSSPSPYPAGGAARAPLGSAPDAPRGAAAAVAAERRGPRGVLDDCVAFLKKELEALFTPGGEVRARPRRLRRGWVLCPLPLRLAARLGGRSLLDCPARGNHPSRHIRPPPPPPPPPPPGPGPPGRAPPRALLRQVTRVRYSPALHFQDPITKLDNLDAYVLMVR
jgi:hypothetical protein